MEIAHSLVDHAIFLSLPNVMDDLMKDVFSARFPVQLCACRNPIIHNQQIKCFDAIFFVYRGDQHTLRINAHHLNNMHFNYRLAA